MRSKVEINVCRTRKRAQHCLRVFYIRSFKNIVFVIIILFMIIFIPVSPGQQIGIDRDSILLEVNNLREAGCTCAGKKMPPAPPLKWSVLLEESALIHASDMDKRNYFSHYSPDGEVMADRVREVRYDWAYIGENIASGQDRFADVFRDWVSSPVHCKIMMNPNFNEMGVARSGDMWVQHLGRQKQ